MFNAVRNNYYIYDSVQICIYTVIVYKGLKQKLTLNLSIFDIYTANDDIIIQKKYKNMCIVHVQSLFGFSKKGESMGREKNICACVYVIIMQ